MEKINTAHNTNLNSEDISLQTLTSFSLTRAKLLVRVVGRSSFDLVKSFTHGRIISNTIFGINLIF